MNQKQPIQPASNSFRHRLYVIIFHSDTPGGRRFDAVLLLVIALSILVVSLETVETIQSKYKYQLLAAEWFFTGLFTIEYCFRLYSSPNPRKYAFSFFGLVDLLSILPTYLSLLVAGSQYLLVIRVLRLLRTARIFKLTKFINEGEMLTSALKASITKIMVFLGTVLTMVVIIGSLMYLIEGREHGFSSIPASIYWAIVTLTTVGYGDIAPQTPLGQILASVVMILGYGIIAVPTGIVTVELSNADKRRGIRKTCPNCYKEDHLPEARFCSQCGTKLTSISRSV